MRPAARAERSAGFVVYRVRTGRREYLLVRDAKHGNWGFPKGHIEPGESELAAARREAREEAGLRGLRATPGFSRRMRYPLATGRSKTVVCFLAGLPVAARVKCGKKEITAHRWLPLKKALKRLTFPASRKVLAGADAFLASGRQR
jgi:8-oxo-dGTP pyrophosphatase MutT (NUDIX family)